ncbi:MAG: hypothetical protein ACK5MQ_14740 [Pikeienuella sp.]
MRMSRLAALLALAAGAAVAQDADLTILVDGPLLEHGGVVEVAVVAAPDVSTAPQTITLTDRYARVTLRDPDGAGYRYRFRPVPAAMTREGMDRFLTEELSYGSHQVDGPDGSPQEADWRSIRVRPFAEYGGPDEATRVAAAWGETERFADPPPANHWGARALPWAFDTFGDRRTVRLICEDDGAVTVCAPDPDDALLMEALWWRSIAEGRLERLRHNALRACYDGGGVFGSPERCEGEAGRGWPTYRPAD